MDYPKNDIHDIQSGNVKGGKTFIPLHISKSQINRFIVSGNNASKPPLKDTQFSGNVPGTPTDTSYQISQQQISLLLNNVSQDKSVGRGEVEGEGEGEIDRENERKIERQRERERQREIIKRQIERSSNNFNSLGILTGTQTYTSLQIIQQQLIVNLL